MMQPGRLSQVMEHIDLAIKNRARLLLVIISLALVVNSIVNVVITGRRFAVVEKEQYQLDLAGRQRMLVERIFSQALLKSHGYAVDFERTFELFMHTSLALEFGGPAKIDLNGDRLEKIPPAPDQAIRDLLRRQREVAEKYKAKISTLFLQTPLNPVLEKSEVFEISNIRDELLSICVETVLQLDDNLSKNITHSNLWRTGLFLMNFLLAGWLLSLALRQIKMSEEVQKATKSALEALEVRNRFFANISHEIRNPLNIVTAIPDILERSPLSDEQKKYVQILKYTSQSLLHMMDDLLDFSRIGAGKITIADRPFSFKKLLEQIVCAWEIKTQEKGLKFIVDIDKKIVDEVSGDFFRLRQVLDNLLGNALKFTKQGTIKLKVKCISLDGESQKVEFEIIDTGCGIAIHDQKKIFDPFMQATTGVSDQSTGSGLGLAIARHLVELMNGKIELESQVNKGTSIRVKLRLPLTDKIPAAEVIEMQEGLNRIKDIRTQTRILCVDDSIDNLLVVSGLLSDHPEFIVETVISGKDALEILKKKKFDLILMDLQMPEMGGEEVVKLWREWERAHKLARTPIVALSASTTRPVDKNFDRALSKPIDRKALLDMTHDVLSMNL